MRARRNVRLLQTGFAGLVALVVLFPLVWLVTGSFKPAGQIFTYPPQIIPQTVTIENFYELFTRGIPFQQYFYNSIVVALGHVLGALVLCSMAGFALAKYRFPFQRVVLALIIAGMLIPFQALVIPLFLVVKDLQFTNTRLALFLPFIAHPLGAFLMRQYMISVPDSLIESARIDGASDMQIFVRVFVPVVQPAFAVFAIVDFVEVWNAFVWPVTVLQDREKFTLPVWLNALIQDPYQNNYGLMFAGALLTVLPIVITFLALRKRFMSGIAVSTGK